jgi:hypothetical protein
MDFSQLLSSAGGILPLILLCVGAIIVIAVLGFVLNFLGNAFDIIGGVFGIFTDLLTGGPLVWCGCLVFLAVLFICGIGGFWLFTTLSTCGTPQAVNLCGLLGG